MHDVNNDMDDLFRDASEQYPLRTDGSDWNKVLQGLQQDDDDASPLLITAPENNKKKRRALWLLLLLPVALLYIVSYNHSQPKNREAKQSKNIEQNRKENNGADSLSSTLSTKENTAVVSNQENNTSNNNDVVNSSIDKANMSVIHEEKEAEKSNKVKDWYSSFNSTHEAEKENQNNNAFVLNNEKNKETTTQPAEEFSRIQTIKTGTDSNTNASVKTEPFDREKSKREETKTADSISTANATTSATTTKKVTARIQNEKGFYVGAAISFDLSTIKLQRINKAGYGLNILAGYRFSNHFSVETGLGLSNKKYYSKGDYFDKSRTDIPIESKIIYTNGSCDMFEIPVAVKYDFMKKRRSNLFVTAGLSSYIMKKENYNYYADHNGWYYSADKKYNNSGSNWFSVTDISVGYQYNINKRTTLRVEPYIKMPLTGVGIAKLPITSTGVSVGFTKSF